MTETTLLVSGVDDVATVALRTRSGTAVVGTAVVMAGPRGPLPVVTGELDGRAEHAFTNGQCHAMALALFERLGGTIVGRGPGPCDHAVECVRRGGMHVCQVDHLLVRLDDDMFVDVHGDHCYEDLVWCYPEEDLHEVPGELLHHLLWEAGGWARPEIEVARTFVDGVVALVEQTVS